MKYAADFRAIARESLRGKWGIAVLGGILAGLLGGIDSGGVSFNVDSSDFENISLDEIKQVFTETEIGKIAIPALAAMFAVSILIGIVLFCVGSIIEIGYAEFNINLVDNCNAEIGDIFEYFHDWKTAIASRFLRGLYTFLWSLLFIIPGIVASYSYAMTPYILAERPELTASEAIAQSKEMMYGNRWRLFCLEISFIGWAILCVFTLGIGNLWLRPYAQAAMAAFYREISGVYKVEEPVVIE